MPVSIVSNAAATYAQRAMQAQNASVIASTQRLTSGQRVFSVDQDPAALAVGTGLKIQNAALNSAMLNVSSGASMLQIADGALGQIGNVLTRMQTLANQSSSGHLSDGDRAVVNQEFLALKDEVNRLSGSTQFNGVAMLTGKTAFDMQGAASYATDGVTSIKLDPAKFATSGVIRYSYDSTTESMTVSRVDGSSTQSQTLDLTALLDAVGGANHNLTGNQTLPITFASLGVTLTLGSAFDRTADILPAVTDNSGADVSFSAAPTFAPTTTNMGVSAVVGDGNGSGGLVNLGGAYSAASGALTLDVNTDGTAVTLAGVTGLRYSVNGGAYGASGAATGDLVGTGTTVDIQVSDGNGGWQTLGRVTLNDVTTAGTTSGTLVVPVGQGLVEGQANATPDGITLKYQVGTGVVAGQDSIEVTIPSVTADGLGLTNLDVMSQPAADMAIEQLQRALDTLNSARAQVGAQQSRLEAVGNNLGVVVENNTQAQSALLDTDASKELTNLATNQAMLQLSIGMLSKVNQLPDMLLQLLRNG